MKIIKKILVFLVLFLLLIPTIYAYSKAPVDITVMSISELENALDKGYLTSELLVELYLDRIEEYNKKYNAILFLNENAIKEAKELDLLRSKGEIKGILHGIPIVVKTNIDVKGIATTAGAKALKDNYPKADSEVVAKLKAAGAIIIGTTNMSEFAFMASDSNSSFGNVKNAYNTLYTPYGSSGGSAVAVATTFAAAALGTDTNSSVRVPASANNLVSIRPSLDLISTKGVIPYDITRDVVGIITKTVADNALILSVVAKKLDNKQIDYTKSINQDKSLANINIGVPNEFLKGKSSSIKALSTTDQDIYNEMLKAIKKLETLGANIIYIDNFYTSQQYNWWSNSLAGFTFCDGFNEYIKNTTGQIRSFSALASSSGRIYSLGGYKESCNYNNSSLNNVYNIRDKYQNHVNKIYETNDFDVIIYPTTKNKLFKLGSGTTIRATSSFVSSAIGYPSITVPLGFIDDLPYGIEFLALKYNEELLYQITSAFSTEEFINPSISPALYKISDSTINLMNLYENEQNWSTKNLRKDFKNQVNELYNEIKDYFKEYNNIENEEEKAKELIAKYEVLEQEKAKNQDNTIEKNFIIKIVIYTLIGLFFMKKIRTLRKKHSRKY